MENEKSIIWKKLIDAQKRLESLFDESMNSYEEDGMSQFNHGMWNNKTWKSEKFRRVHIEVVDARETKSLWIMHFCIFPRLNSGAPIFGFDVIAGQNKITGAFLDYSPIDSDHAAIDQFRQFVQNVEWSKPRELPDWAKQIFSKYMVAAGNIRTLEELDVMINLLMKTVNWYINDMSLGAYFSAVEGHNRYAFYQKQNPHASKTLKALGLADDQVDTFIENYLFPVVT
jgi:hypothetical protein